MSDTPETDTETMRDEYDHVDSDFGPFAPSDTVPADFARYLERERDEANKELHKQTVQYDQLFGEAEKIRIERDKAREELEEAQLCLKKAITELDLASIEIFKWERDFKIIVNDFKTVVKQLNK